MPKILARRAEQTDDRRADGRRDVHGRGIDADETFRAFRKRAQLPDADLPAEIQAACLRERQEALDPFPFDGCRRGGEDRRKAAAPHLFEKLGHAFVRPAFRLQTGNGVDVNQRTGTRNQAGNRRPIRGRHWKGERGVPGHQSDHAQSRELLHYHMVFWIGLRDVGKEPVLGRQTSMFAVGYSPASAGEPGQKGGAIVGGQKIDH